MKTICPDCHGRGSWFERIAIHARGLPSISIAYCVRCDGKKYIEQDEGAERAQLALLKAKYEPAPGAEGGG